MELTWLGVQYPIALRLVGAHNAMNAAGAFAMGVALGYAPEACVRGLEAAQPHARRLQVVDGPGGITVIDDCYNANPSSMTAALQTLKTLAGAGRAVAVVGDMLELGDGETAAHDALVAEAMAAAAVVAFFGPRTSKAAGAPANAFTDIDELKTWLGAQLKHGDTVLVKGSRGMKLERVVEALTGSTGGAH